MRENRTYGSEGGEAKSLPYPYPALKLTVDCSQAMGALRHAPCCAHLGEDRVQAFDHFRDLLPCDVERRHETQRVWPRGVEQHTYLKRLRDDRGADGMSEIER